VPNRASRGIIAGMALLLAADLEPEDTRSRNAMLRAFFDYSRYSLAAALLLVVLHAVVVWPAEPAALVLAWAALFVLLLAQRARWRSTYLALPLEQAAQAWRVWRQRAIWGAGLTGGLWALALLMAFERDDALAQMYCATLACLTGVGSINVMAPLPRAFFALVVPIVLVLAGLFASLVTPQDWRGLYLAALVLAAAAMSSGLMLRHARLLLHSHSLRFQREDLVQQLEQANAAKSRFLAAASHDLRQPMQALGLLSTQLREELTPGLSGPGRTAERLQAVVHSLDRLVDALFDISRLDHGAATVSPRAVALAPVLERLSDEFAPLAEERGLQWRLRHRADWVLADPMALERMLRNLLANALHYTQRGGVLLSVQRRSDRARVAVWDTGPGIAPHEQARVFEEFVSLEPVGQAPRTGLGLGLSIVQRLAALQGHTVHLKSRLGCGSCFAIDLPLAAKPAGLTAMAATPTPALQGLSVLVVEDDAEVRQGMHGLMQGWGCEVQALSDWPPPGAAEPGGAGQLRPAARLICDWQLPSGNGLQAIQALRMLWGADVPALLLSGAELPAELHQQAVASGIHFARKPLAPAALRAWLAST
jgi:two-component system, sensor histidine kinase